MALTGAALIKETCRRIHVARSYRDAHNKRACQGERDKAMKLSFMWRLNSLVENAEVCSRSRIELWNWGPFLENSSHGPKKLNDKVR